MAKYMLKVSYSAEGIKGVMRSGGSARVESVSKTLAGVGGSLEAFYFALGSDDVIVIVDVPGNVEAAAIAATIGSSGAISSYETVALLSPAEIDAAAKLTVDYRPPGT